MNRIDRLVATLIHLQSKRIVKAEEIAKRFDISLRTVYRDIRALEEAGVPIGAEAGIGYFIADGYQLPPVVFTRQEAGALVTGEMLLAKFADKSLAENYSSAMRKVRAVLKGTDKEYIESLEEKMIVHRGISNQPEQFPNRFAVEVQEALALQKVLDIEYFSRYNESTNRREVEPLGIFFYNGRWHLLGWCRMRKDYRDFRIDRIKSLQILEATFKKNDKRSLQNYFNNEMLNKDVTKLVVKFKNSIAKFMVDERYYYGFVDEKKGEEYTEMTFYYYAVDYFARWLLMFTDAAEIVSPDALKVKMQQLVKEIHQHNAEPLAQ